MAWIQWLSSFLLFYFFHIANIVYKDLRTVERLAVVENMILCTFVVSVKLTAWGQTDDQSRFFDPPLGVRAPGNTDQHTWLNTTAFLD
jgi:hypothetical protein